MRLRIGYRNREDPVHGGGSDGGLSGGGKRGGRGYLDKIDVKYLAVFEEAWLKYVYSSQRTLVDTIKTKGAIDDPTMDLMKSSMETFISEQCQDWLRSA